MLVVSMGKGCIGLLMRASVPLMRYNYSPSFAEKKWKKLLP